ncbi:MAG: alkaline phosphatase [Dehalococcoidia bacterium]|nr:MAG: alkaline phosphatase [Dehalococcoidia bacterium]
MGRAGVVFAVFAAFALGLLVAHLVARSDTPAQKATADATAVSTTSSKTDAKGDAVIVAAGDIACGPESSGAKCEQQATSDVVIAQHPDAVLVLGDSQYECGQYDDYTKYFDPTWGRFKDLIRPAIGNHEYRVGADAEGACGDIPSGAPGYWNYFGDAASPTEPGCRLKCKGYYSYDAGAWHIIALNDECSHVGGCDKGSPEERWLQADLAAHPAACTLAYFHEPRWSSGNHGSILNSAAFWDDLYAAGAEIVLNGHEHDYERFAPQTPDGKPDPDRGIREFVVGTGGRNHTGVSRKTGRIANSEVFDFKTFGVLKLTLHADSYDWQFVPVAGATFTDSGSGKCH